MKLKLLDLFSGIGGFSLGLESTGYFETIAFVEKDKFCQQVLKKNFKDIPIESEVRDVKGERYAADIITGGFPCQPFSVAGKRRGTDDDRYLWDETIRIIRECKPRWFIGENVEGIINIQDGLVLRQVQDDLEKEGFEVQCLVIPASGIGAWHQRKRVWILAYSKHNGSHRSKGNETIESSNQSKEWLFIRDDQNVPNSNSRLSIGENEEIQARRNTINSSSKDVSDTNKRNVEAGCKGQWGVRKESKRQGSSSDATCFRKTLSNTNEQRTQVQIKRKHTSIEMSGSSSKETWWQTQSKLCGVPNGISYELDKGRANRIKSLGNSIVPLIARELGIAIIKAETDG
jgi:DNA (cytosine-5)-methyltransferase 1